MRFGFPAWTLTLISVYQIHTQKTVASFEHLLNADWLLNEKEEDVDRGRGFFFLFSGYILF